MNKLLRVLLIFFITAILVSPVLALACIWDADSLDSEKKKKPEIAEIIFGTGKEAIDTPRLQKRIVELKSNPRENEAAWWNDLAGAYLRLGQPQDAANLLEPVVKKFDSDYGMHANLGTAYHLLGRYQEAEREIDRDLEINPDAHFGLEKYHLALLQYLSRDAKYKQEHVYIDEFSEVFLQGEWDTLDLMHPVWDDGVLVSTNIENDFPDYRLKWNLATDTNLNEGVIYMASLNPREPACFVMLGIACLSDDRRDLNLAAAAFQKAIKLNSPQDSVLEKRIDAIKEHIRTAQGQRSSFGTTVGVGALIVITIVVGGFLFLFVEFSEIETRLFPA